MAQFLLKVAKTVAKPTYQSSILKSKISTLKPIWGLKMPMTNHVLKLLIMVQMSTCLYKNQPKMLPSLWAPPFLQKNHNELPKVAQLAKNRPIWSPWSSDTRPLEPSYIRFNQANFQLRFAARTLRQLVHDISNLIPKWI